jgi:hypothetical protein
MILHLWMALQSPQAGESKLKIITCRGLKSPLFVVPEQSNEYVWIFDCHGVTQTL